MLSVLITNVIIAIIAIIAIVMASKEPKPEWIALPASTGTIHVIKNYDNYEMAAKLIDEHIVKINEFIEKLVLSQTGKSRADMLTAVAINGPMTATNTINTAKNKGAGIGVNDRYLIIQNIAMKFKSSTVYENPPAKIVSSEMETSYTINKGERMYLCVRNFHDHREFIDSNTIMFVLLHEISHIGTYESWGHGERFWQVFKFILQEASKMGIYTPIDYKANPIVYCGMNVDYSPLFNAELVSA